MSALFAGGPDDVAALVAETPLCWIVPHAEPTAAILMPVVLERDHDGAARSLLGHLPRSAPATTALVRNGAASFLFLGANNYISPTDAGRSDWGPTWNFASARITGRVALDPDLTAPALVDLVDRLEGADGWTVAALGERYDRLAAQIIGFRAGIDAVAPRFKLAQDERPDVRASILTAFAGTPLGRWMRRLSP